MPVTIADDRDPDPHDAPRRAEPQRDAGHRRARDAAAVEEAVEPNELPGVVRERVGRDDVHHHVDESARGHRQHEGRHEHREVRGDRLQREERAPGDRARA